MKPVIYGILYTVQILGKNIEFGIQHLVLGPSEMVRLYWHKTCQLNDFIIVLLILYKLYSECYKTPSDNIK